MMNRRGFLRGLLGTAAVAATNPVHFLPPIGGWKSDVIVNPNEGALALALEQIYTQPELLISNDHFLDNLLYGGIPKNFYMHPAQYATYIRLTEEIPFAEAKERFQISQSNRKPLVMPC